MSHAADPELLNRLRRAHGHLAKIIRMVDEGREGLDIAQQMQAVVAALEKAKTVLVIDHIEHHLEAAVGPLSKDARDELARLAALARYL
jgi:DNA-binding FrmR family transcriptional regulator